LIFLAYQGTKEAAILAIHAMEASRDPSEKDEDELQDIRNQ
jgi:hypothetical protein